MGTQLSRNEMIRALVVAIQKLHRDKHIAVHEDHLSGSNRWVVTVDGLGVFDRMYACEVLADVRAAKGLDEVSVEANVAELLACASQAQTAAALGPAAVALGPSSAPAAPQAPAAIDYAALAAAIVKAQGQPAPAAPAGKL